MKRNRTAPGVRVAPSIIAIFFGPLFLYPAFYLTTLAGDTFFGDKIIIDQVLNVSKRNVWNVFWSDWLLSLPVSYLIGLPLLAVTLFARVKSGITLWAILPVASVIVSSVVVGVFFDGEHWFLVVATGLLFAIPATGVLSACTK